MKLPNPPVSRRMAGRILRAFNANIIVLSVPDQHACKEALTCGFVGDQLRRRLLGLWLLNGKICLEHEDKTRRSKHDDELDSYLV